MKKIIKYVVKIIALLVIFNVGVEHGKTVMLRDLSSKNSYLQF